MDERLDTSPCLTFNFYNIDDFALFRGSYPIVGAANWEENQIIFKPHNPVNLLRTKAYSYHPNNQIGERCILDLNSFGPTRDVVDIHESMSYVARPRSKAIGAEPNAFNVFQNSINLKGYGFGSTRSDHSGQFNRNIQELNEFYMSAPRKACRLLRVEVPHEQSLASSSSPKVYR